MTASVDDLLAVEERLDRSFGVAVVLFLACNVGWPLLTRAMGVTQQGWANTVFNILWVLLLAAYVWFAWAAGAAAARVGRSKVLTAAWIVLAPALLAPLAGLLGIPFLGLLISASPLSIRFVLAGELRSEIRTQTLA